ncbi:MAG: hypothetical protein KBF82_13570 [Chitinophagaceae bacterium]|nr:hypothetical protein [Chitinophagaceae bacterium]MBP9104889.1 hypothetical protein [Chitinophagaceae bacterium]
MPVFEKQKKGRYVMKFLLVVLAIRFIVELISNKRKENKNSDAEVLNKNIRHPAEYQLR